jgi:hypothetical protein
MYEVNFLLKWKIWKMKLQVWASDKLKSELEVIEDLIKGKKECWRAQRGYQKYTKQQETVRNNRDLTL